MTGLVKSMDHRKQTGRKCVVKKPPVNTSGDKPPKCSGKVNFIWMVLCSFDKKFIHLDSLLL